MKFEKIILPIIFLFSGFSLLISSCSAVQEKNVNTKQANISADTIESLKTITDSRDGEIYPIITIGTQTWMAENLRYNASGSLVNPDYPSTKYGRLYFKMIAQTACPKGWHLPSDLEWNELETALGMSTDDRDKIGWRGTHGTKMKSTTGWLEDKNGTNNSGFNAYPAGFYFLDEEGNNGNFDGLGGSVGFWSSLSSLETNLDFLSVTKGTQAWLRFFGGPLEGVNRFDDNESDWAVACRCVRN